MIIKATVDGVEQEFESMGIRTEGATHVMLATGDILPRQTDAVHDHLRYFRLIRPRHTFGPEDGPKVVFEETGEMNIPPGHFYMSDERLYYHFPGSRGNLSHGMTLRPVAIEASECPPATRESQAGTSG